jgi:pimeloyl-ACP methyl ester carboxylesterase
MTESAPPRLDGVEHLDVTVRRVRWHVAAAGEGPPVVLLHGWPQSWWAWREVIPLLAADHRVYAPDLRGFGSSDAPEGRYSKAGLAADVEELLDVLELESCVLAGHDWGGFVAFLAALRAPDRIERLAAFSIIHPWIRPPKPSPLSLLKASYQFVLAAPVVGEQVQLRVPRLVEEALRRGAGPGHRFSETDLKIYSEAYRRPAHARAASALYRTFLMRELPALASGRYANRRLDVPGVLAFGDRDPVITRERVAGLSEHAPNMDVVVVEGAGHWLPEERPHDVARLIRGEAT